MLFHCTAPIANEVRVVKLEKPSKYDKELNHSIIFYRNKEAFYSTWLTKDRAGYIIDNLKDGNIEPLFNECSFNISFLCKEGTLQREMAVLDEKNIDVILFKTDVIKRIKFNLILDHEE